ncbi:MAG: hypothetical protein H6Q03_2860, partial [Acidobacteria bacterium]|nr:hypothetical protein [Acidobacteriota bacterium]
AAPAAAPGAGRRGGWRAAAGVAAALLAALGAAIWLGRGEPGAGPVLEATAPVPEAGREVPPAARAEPALLVLDARPWGSVTQLVSLADGRELEIPGDGFTPLRVALAAGRYRAVVVHPSFGSRALEVELASGAVEVREVRFGTDLAESFVRGF